MKIIPPYYWLTYTLFNWAISYALTNRDVYGIFLGLEDAISSSLLLLLIIILFWSITKVLRIKTNRPVILRLFVFFATLLSIVVLTRAVNRRSDLIKQQFVEECVSRLKTKNAAFKLTNYNLEDYCECILEKSAQANKSDSLLYSDFSSTEYLDKFGGCWGEAFVPRQIVGESTSAVPDTIDVLPSPANIKVKIRVNGKEIYAILDTGASDVLLSMSFIENDLQATGWSFTGEEMEYQLADGSTISAKHVIINELSIGAFVFKDIVVAVSEDLANPLLGKSILDHFRSWTILDHNKLILIP